MRALISLAASVPLAMSLWSGHAGASQEFPDVVKAAVPSLPCVPQCTLCHQTNPGVPPANKPFALNLKAAGSVLPKQTEALRNALVKLQAMGAASDADKDGKGDFDELKGGEDPNSAEMGATLCQSVPLYGCGASTIAHMPSQRVMDPTGAVATVLTALAGVLLLRRRRA